MRPPCFRAPPWPARPRVPESPLPAPRLARRQGRQKPIFCAPSRSYPPRVRGHELAPSPGAGAEASRRRPAAPPVQSSNPRLHPASPRRIRPANPCWPGLKTRERGVQVCSHVVSLGSMRARGRGKSSAHSSAPPGAPYFSGSSGYLSNWLASPWPALTGGV